MWSPTPVPGQTATGDCAHIDRYPLTSRLTLSPQLKRKVTSRRPARALTPTPKHPYPEFRRQRIRLLRKPSGSQPRIPRVGISAAGAGGCLAAVEIERGGSRGGCLVHTQCHELNRPVILMSSRSGESVGG